MSQTNYLQIVIFDLQRTAGPYRSARLMALQALEAVIYKAVQLGGNE